MTPQSAFEILLIGLCVGGIYSLVALGYSLVYSILGVINFAHGEIYAWGAYIGLIAWAYGGVPIAGALLIGSVGAAGLAGALERWVYRPVVGRNALPLLVTQIGVSVVLRSLLSLSFGEGFRSLRPPDAPVCTVSLFSVRIASTQLTVLAATILIGVALSFLAYRTSFGRKLRAVADDADLARARGIDVPRVVSMTFIIGGLAAGCAGVLAGRITELTPQMGAMVGLKGFTASVLGGIGNIKGTLIAGFVIGVLEAAVVASGAAAYRDAVIFALLIALLLAAPQGLLGRAQTA